MKAIVMPNQKKTILMTGGTGYLGSNLARALCDTFQLIILKRSSSSLRRVEAIRDNVVFYNIDEINLGQVFQSNAIDMVLHCATHYGRKTVNPLEIIEANLVLPFSLLSLAKSHGVKCFINTDTILDKGINAYSLSKSQFKDWLKILATDIVCVNMELEHFYGPMDDSSKFVTYLIHSLLRGEPEIKLTKGEQKRYFIYIDDVVHAFRTVMENSGALRNGFWNFQIGSYESICIRDFVNALKSLVGNTKTRLNFGALPYRDGEVMDPKLDMSPLSNLGWEMKVSLEDGLQKTIRTEKELLGL